MEAEQYNARMFEHPAAKRRRLGAIVVVVGMVVAACGSGDDSATPDPGTDNAEATAERSESSDDEREAEDAGDGGTTSTSTPPAADDARLPVEACPLTADEITLLRGRPDGPFHEVANIEDDNVTDHVSCYWGDGSPEDYPWLTVDISLATSSTEARRGDILLAVAGSRGLPEALNRGEATFREVDIGDGGWIWDRGFRAVVETDGETLVFDVGDVRVVISLLPGLDPFEPGVVETVGRSLADRLST